MSYTALYRKWRPKSFEDVIGQDHIIKTLKNQIVADRIAHAYLFCGTRGTGKTSTAKIFAKAINCASPVAGSPCLACDICLRVEQQQNLNIVEIDAASNNGVDNIREIRDEVRYAPTEGRFKVYIIDEVHMLSIGAFNALLKTLEEPPAHVVFILATTEPHKIPITILSRCQRYDFRRITRQHITEALMKFMAKEGVAIEEKAVTYIAKVADGSMRDALSVLDQCIAFYLGEMITYDKVLNVLGAVDNAVFEDLSDALLALDTKKSLELIETLSDQGRDLDQFVVDMVTYFRNLLIAKSTDVVYDILDLSTEQINGLILQANHFETSSLMYYIRRFSEMEARLKYVSQKRILLEVELIKLCHPEVDSTNDGLLQRLVGIEQKLANGLVVSEKEAIVEKPLVTIEQKLYPKALTAEIEAALGRFGEVMDLITDRLIKAILFKITPVYLGDETLYVLCESDYQKNILKQPDNHVKIVKALETIHERTFDVMVVTEKEFNHLSHEQKDTTTGVEEAKEVYKKVRTSQKVNFPIEKGQI